MRHFLMLFCFFVFAPISYAQTKDTIEVRVGFHEETQYGQYNDSLYYPIDTWKDVTQEQIDKKKLERVNNYISAVENVQPPAEPTKAEIQTEITNLEIRLLELKNKLVSIASIDE